MRKEKELFTTNVENSLLNVCDECIQTQQELYFKPPIDQ